MNFHTLSNFLAHEYDLNNCIVRALYAIFVMPQSTDVMLFKTYDEKLFYNHENFTRLIVLIDNTFDENRIQITMNTWHGKYSLFDTT